MSAVGALAGLGVGVGIVVVAARTPWARRGTVVDRLVPYLERPSGVATGRHADPVTPFPTLERILRPVVVDLARTLDRRLGGRDALERRLERAGAGITVEAFRVEQVLWAVAGLAVALSLVLLMLAQGRTVAPVPAALLLVLGAAGGVLSRDHMLERAVRGRAARMSAEFPTVAELLAFAVAAGEGAAGAVARVTRTARGELGAELARALADTRSGDSLVSAMRALADRTALPVVVRFVDGVVIALERGTPLAEVLRAQAADARAASRRELLELAGRREIAMLVPVVFLVLPAVVVVALFPGFYGVVLAVP